MPMGDDFRDETAAPVLVPKVKLHYPPPDGTGAIPWPVGQSFAQALAAGLPQAVKDRTLTVKATIRVMFHIEED